MKHKTWFVLGTLACLSTYLAIPDASAQKDDATSRVDQLGVPVGDFSCTGNLMKTAKRPGYPTVAHLHVEKVLDGHWIVFHYDEEQTAENSKPYHVVQYIGYDEGSKRYVSTTIDNTGAGYTGGISTGLVGNVITVDENVPADDGTAYRDTFTKTADDLTHTGTLRGKDKKWVKTDEETCHKS